MRKLKTILIFTLIILLFTGCNKSEKYETNKTTTLRGKIVTNTIKQDDEEKTISVLELEKAITIDGVSVDKIEIDYDKALKNNTETTITGTLKDNKGSTDLKYSIDVDSVDNILSYINTFSNDIFSVAIPPKLMKTVSVNPVSNGFIIYSKGNSEAFKILALNNQEYKNLSRDDINFEKIKSNKDYTIVIIYPTENGEDELTKEEQTIYEEIDNIKSSIKIK